MQLYKCKNNHWFTEQQCPYCQSDIDKTVDSRDGDCIFCGTLCPVYGYACYSPHPIKEKEKVVLECDDKCLRK